MKEFLIPYVSELIAGAIALILGWFAKSRTHRKSENADVLKKVQTIYDKMVKDTNERMDELKGEIDELKKKQSRIDLEWRKKVQEVERKWQTKYSRLQTKYNNLLKEFEHYKSAH